MTTDSRRHDPVLTRAQACEQSQDVGINPSANSDFAEIAGQRYGRRQILQGLMAATALSVTGCVSAQSGQAGPARGHSRSFSEISRGVDGAHHVAPGHEVQVVMRWGDPVAADAPAFDPLRQSAAAQQRQFGYNNDYTAFMPLPPGSQSSDHGLLFVNHEYTNEELMFPGLGVQESKAVNFAGMTPDLVNIEMAAHGLSVVELKKTDGKWAMVTGSRYNRRVEVISSLCDMTGPAAGHPRLRTMADPSGRQVVGTLNNCAGGVTPWGTVLSGEENFHGYFWGSHDPAQAEARNHKRYGVPGNWFAWGKFHDRFNLAREPNEANRFGWVVELDPYDPAARPKKRTALGRMKHEGASPVVNRDGRVVVYTGDDERFEYVYRFVSEGKFQPNNRAANMDLLDSGVLSVAKFLPDGRVQWLPLVFGQGPLVPANGFHSQADVLIEARTAADLLGATKMDRPEEIEISPATGKVYAVMTNNSRRRAEQLDAANSRPANLWGQIIELVPPGGDHAADSFAWSVFIRGGNPADPKAQGLYHPDTSANGWFACPDNVAFDPRGRLWVGTDQGEGWKAASGAADGIWAVETEGPDRGYSRMFFRAPVGAEICGPTFTPDGRTLFVAIQHPAADGAEAFTRSGKGSTFEDPGTRWPDFDPKMPPRPSVIAITRADGKPLGG